MLCLVLLSGFLHFPPGYGHGEQPAVAFIYPEHAGEAWAGATEGAATRPAGS